MPARATTPRSPWPGRAASTRSRRTFPSVGTPRTSSRCSRPPEAAPPLDWVHRILRWDAALAAMPAGVRGGKGIRIGHPDTGYTRHPNLGMAGLDLNVDRDVIDGDNDALDDLEQHPLWPLPFPGHGTSTSSVIVGHGPVERGHRRAGAGGQAGPDPGDRERGAGLRLRRRQGGGARPPGRLPRDLDEPGRQGLLRAQGGDPAGRRRRHHRDGRGRQLRPLRHGSGELRQLPGRRGHGAGRQPVGRVVPGPRSMSRCPANRCTTRATPTTSGRSSGPATAPRSRSPTSPPRRPSGSRSTAGTS